jgi:hypothetical protein
MSVPPRKDTFKDFQSVTSVVKEPTVNPSTRIIQSVDMPDLILEYKVKIVSLPPEVSVALVKKGLQRSQTSPIDSIGTGEQKIFTS